MKKLKRISLILLAFALCMPMMAEKNAQAKKILDATAKKINGASGIEAVFKLTSFVGNTEQGTGTGTILLKGKKYKLDAGGQITWFDGKTLWNYDADIQEVNVTTPTKQELQAMNPYSFVSLYKQGYNYKVKNVKYSGKDMYEVSLTAEKAGAEIPEILVTISKDYTPMCIRMRQGKNWTRINITSFSSNKKPGDNLFRFPASQYPDAEIIDMR